MSMTTSDDEELVEEVTTEHLEQQQNKHVPPRRKLWEKTPRDVHWTLRFEGNGVKTAENNPGETGRTIPMVPGLKTYSGAVRSSSAPTETTIGDNDFKTVEKLGKIAGIKSRRRTRESKTLIFASSITRDIKKRSFNLECTSSEVVFHEFRGKKAKDIVRYMVPHLEEEQPSSVVFVAGGNDLPERDMSANELRKVANCLLEGGRECREKYGVENVFISSVLPRSNSQIVTG